MNQMTENEPPDDKIPTSLMTQDAHFPNLHLGGSYLARKPVWGTVQPVISQNMSSNKGIFMKRFIKMVLGEGLHLQSWGRLHILVQGCKFSCKVSLSLWRIVWERIKKCIKERQQNMQRTPVYTCTVIYIVYVTVMSHGTPRFTLHIKT